MSAMVLITVLNYALTGSYTSEGVEMKNDNDNEFVTFC